MPSGIFRVWPKRLFRKCKENPSHTLLFFASWCFRLRVYHYPTHRILELTFLPRFRGNAYEGDKPPGESAMNRERLSLMSTLLTEVEQGTWKNTGTTLGNLSTARLRRGACLCRLPVQRPGPVLVLARRWWQDLDLQL